MGSASELEYHLVLSRDLNLVKNQDYEKTREQVEEVKRMLAALIRKIALERSERD
jgi:four helix bundle protein